MIVVCGESLGRVWLIGRVDFMELQVENCLWAFIVLAKLGRGILGRGLGLQRYGYGYFLIEKKG